MIGCEANGNNHGACTITVGRYLYRYEHARSGGRFRLHAVRPGFSLGGDPVSFVEVDVMESCTHSHDLELFFGNMSNV